MRRAKIIDLWKKINASSENKLGIVRDYDNQPKAQSDHEKRQDDHVIVRAAVAVKHKYGAVALTDEENEAIEKVTGQKTEKTWLGKNEDGAEPHPLEKNENGEYIILLELEEERNAFLAQQKALDEERKAAAKAQQ